MKIQDALPVQSLHPRRTVISTAAPSVLYLPGGALGYAGTGAGVLSTSSGVAGYALPDAVASSARGLIALPPAWAGRAVRLRIAWLPADANAGNVLWSAANLRRVSSGRTLAVLEDVANTVAATLADASKPVVTAIDFAALPTDITAGEFLSIAVARNGGAGTDTYANTVYLLGLSLELR
jgi:hypothetical protein